MPFDKLCDISQSAPDSRSVGTFDLGQILSSAEIRRNRVLDFIGRMGIKRCPVDKLLGWLRYPGIHIGEHCRIANPPETVIADRKALRFEKAPEFQAVKT